MTDRTTRTLLWMSALGCLGIGGGVFAMAFMALPPRETVWERPALPSPGFPLTQETSKAQMTVTDFQHVWTKVLRGPLNDPPPVVVANEPKQKPEKTLVKKWRLDAKLLGTLVDSNRARAWVEFKGNRKMMKVGDVLDRDPAKPVVTDIQDRLVVFSANDSKHTLTLAKSAVFAEVDVSKSMGTKSLGTRDD